MAFYYKEQWTECLGDGVNVICAINSLPPPDFNTSPEHREYLVEYYVGAIENATRSSRIAHEVLTWKSYTTIDMGGNSYRCTKYTLGDDDAPTAIEQARRKIQAMIDRARLAIAEHAGKRTEALAFRAKQDEDARRIAIARGLIKEED